MNYNAIVIIMDILFLGRGCRYFQNRSGGIKVSQKPRRSFPDDPYSSYWYQRNFDYRFGNAV